MESTSFSSYNLLNFNQRPLRHGPKYRRKSGTFIVASTGGINNKSNGPDYVGKLVDENMIVLRMRIKDTKISEGFELPSEWMEWEKQYYLHYNEDVCEAMGVLQNLLVNVRPSFGIAMVVLVLLSFPISTGVTLFHVLQLGQWFISGFNPN
ncbi:uncharacterized protein LOC108488554 [Gossypium arboreum]|uniref:Uncharacterized protein n=1 Tax=Gossypium arboreum TaxID=29729 RepID=A0ABR0P9Y3_GOSAR|nr:uncharacterized protein LOC108488554 [Gossypium arboreum]KAK5818018.1 hypothetical protein PVK06_022949 [Gossypium arboreum]